MRQILVELNSVADGGLPCAVCTVIATRGSTPQKPGAMMLVFPDGTQAGTLGGGCTEAEVRRRALAANDADTQIHSFQLDDDYGWDDGLICGGRMTVLVEPQNAPYFRRVLALFEAGSGHTEVVALAENEVGAAAGARAVFDATGQWLAGAQELATLAADLPALTTRPRPSLLRGCAVLPTLPRVTLFIIGAGHVGRAVAQLAHDTDFDVWVLDDREKFANAERFPHANRILVGDIGRELQTLHPALGPSHYCLIVTRGHNHDEEALFQVAKSKAAFVGMIGSKRKVKLILDDLRAKEFSDETLSRVHAPVGLPIGSQTVPEIAVSIVAELIAQRNLGPKTTQLTTTTQRHDVEMQ